MKVAEVDNDTRGWIMCLVSGVACMIGSCIIYVDEVVRLFPGQKDFRIQDNNTFLACSLSLSFGVMMFMSLYSMLPEAKDYLKKGGFPDQAAGFILIGCFVGGFVGIQILSRLFHQFLPSHVVDCDHSHDDHALDGHNHSDENGFSRRLSSHAHSVGRRPQSMHVHFHAPKHSAGENGHANEITPLLSREVSNESHPVRPLRRAETAGPTETGPHAIVRGTRSRTATSDRRPSMLQKRVMSFVKDTKPNCDEAGPCYGYSDPCGQECFKHLSSRSGLLSRVGTTLLRTTTTAGHSDSCIDTVEEVGDHDSSTPVSPTFRSSRAHSHDPDHHENACFSETSEDLESQHHHHVAENAFLSIGLQTSIAIALHKFPEGFITYATNHANPSLGFNVFLALFVHNITEGFALALPLYMALHSRLRAMAWASILGGLSQPLGAGIAVLWFKLAQHHSNFAPDAVAYGCLFAATAGIMASVALQLFVESLSLNHNQNLSILFAFLGMTLLGVSNAFTAHAH
ncbi:Zinc/iron permease [Annulohypoxylon truncatum]|uniref:Zinc/iron permease n=1 Tax=Annulohypoxylon truncatum TaxID=327061 RepID=UPI00200806B6|nr:Zinc/iron permease [Annulohypoxylon truncatum]KAI1212886.1 Zinc/iron permease [Annulohypoxylon truncatum]